MIFKTVNEPKYKFYTIKGYRVGTYGLLEISEIKGKFLTENQAKLKIKTLDDNFEYFVIPEFNWVRPEDIEIGKKIYVAHPFYGIDEITPKSKAMKYGNWDCLWFKVDCLLIADLNYNSCSDAGMYEKTYNDRRTFFTKMEAEHYVKIVSQLPDVIERHEEHERRCNEDYLWAWEL